MQMKAYPASGVHETVHVQIQLKVEEVVVGSTKTASLRNRTIKCIREHALVGIIVEHNNHVLPRGRSITIIVVALMKHVMKFW